MEAQSLKGDPKKPIRLDWRVLKEESKKLMWKYRLEADFEGESEFKENVINECDPAMSRESLPVEWISCS